MSGYFVNVSFKLHDGQLENWKALSTEIDTDIAKVDGFVSRDSGIDADDNVYCLIKWESKAHQEAFMASLMSRDDAGAMMLRFGSIANFDTQVRQEIDLF